MSTQFSGIFLLCCLYKENLEFFYKTILCVSNDCSVFALIYLFITQQYNLKLIITILSATVHEGRGFISQHASIYFCTPCHFSPTTNTNTLEIVLNFFFLAFPLTMLLVCPGIFFYQLFCLSPFVMTIVFEGIICCIRS